MMERARFPLSPAWRKVALVPGGAAWQLGPIRVVSTLDMAELPDRSGVGPQWHVSVTSDAHRPHQKEVRKALRAFGMAGSEVDNHEPGNAEHFWLPVDPAHRVDCECKTDETVVVEPDGHRWSNPKNGPCSGCRLERLIGKPCSIHQVHQPSP